MNKVGAHTQGTGAAQGGDGGDAAGLYGFIIGTEQQILARFAVARQAVHRQIRARLRRIGTRCLSGFDAFEHRQAACFVVIHPHAEVYFNIVARVLVEFVH